MNVRSRRGLAAWQRLCSLYQPRVPNRHLAMLVNVLHAKFTDKDFLEDLNCWERDVDDYEKSSGDTISAQTRMAIVLGQAPASVKEHLYVSSDQPDDYAGLRQRIMQYYTSRKVWQKQTGATGGTTGADPQGPAPMEIGA
eukprot:15480209-Alexandrium_andersonii.AAC.1